MKYSIGSCTFKDKCSQLGISLSAAYKYKFKHPELTDEQVLEYYLNRETFSSKCNRFEINYIKAHRYKSKHPELTEEQVILHFRSDLCINIFGEIVSINGE